MRARRNESAAGLTVTLVVLAALGLAALGYVGFVLWPRWPAPTRAMDAPSLPIKVGGVIFNVPPAAIRTAAQRSAGAQPRLDLVFQWPDLSPPQPGAKPPLSDDLKPNQLFITITGPQGTLPLSERIRTIYPRYTSDAAFTGPAGLAGVSFRDGTPYQGEDLFFDPENAERFAARCTRPSGPMAGTCLLERHVGEAEVTVRFLREWLPDWRALVENTDRLLARLKAPVAN
ncbi:MAG: hypothetical protein IRZ09_02345 [Variibacter sp.]|nr:hypothetical protein [Variibacter sp.]